MCMCVYVYMYIYEIYQVLALRLSPEAEISLSQIERRSTCIEGIRSVFIPLGKFIVERFYGFGGVGDYCGE